MIDLKHSKVNKTEGVFTMIKEGSLFIATIALGALLLAIASTPANAACQSVNGYVYCQQDYRTDYNSPRIYDQDGNYRGNLNGNQYDPNSISNPYGRYGSKYSSDSINNPYAQPLNNYYSLGN